MHYCKKKKERNSLLSFQFLCKYKIIPQLKVYTKKKGDIKTTDTYKESFVQRSKEKEKQT